MFYVFDCPSVYVYSLYVTLYVSISPYVSIHSYMSVPCISLTVPLYMFIPCMWLLCIYLSFNMWLFPCHTWHCRHMSTFPQCVFIACMYLSIPMPLYVYLYMSDCSSVCVYALYMPLYLSTHLYMYMPCMSLTVRMFLYFPSMRNYFYMCLCLVCGFVFIWGAVCVCLSDSLPVSTLLNVPLYKSTCLFLNTSVLLYLYMPCVYLLVPLYLPIPLYVSHCPIVYVYPLYMLLFMSVCLSVLHYVYTP